MKKYDTLVIAGGGLYGLMYLGAIKYYMEKDQLNDVKEYVGTSIGSILCILISLNCNVEMIKTWLNENTLLHKNDINVFNIFEKYGIDCGDRLTNVLESKLKDLTGKSYINFKTLHEITGKKVTITGVNVSKMCVEYFNHQTTPYMHVSKALRISCSIPIIFTPVELNNDIYVDGGLLDNVPVNYVNKKENKILAIKSKLLKTDINNILTFVSSMINTIRINNERINDTENVDIIEIDYDKNVPLISYDYTKYIDKLITQGYNHLKRG